MLQTSQADQRHRAATMIQSWFRGERCRQSTKTMIKDFFKREQIIKQLVDTEEKYIRDLSVVISDFKIAMLKKKIITAVEAQIIFSNIDQIRKLNQLFFATIFNLAENYSHYKIIFQKVEKQIYFFKMYFEYFNNFTNSMNKIDQLCQDNSAFDEFVRNIRINPKYHLLTIKDYLIKPVQRLPKYVLIMKEVKRRTPLYHPDSKNIDKVLHIFEQVNYSNNQKLNKVVNGYKIGEIQKNLMLPHVISQPGVQFILEEPVTILTMDSEILECTMYLLNTEIIIARKVGGKQKFIVSIPFKNGGGNIMQNEDHFYFKNSFTVQNGEGDSCTFICKDDEEKETLIRKIYNQLMKADQKNIEKISALCSVKNKQNVQFLKKMSRLDLLPQIQILGTEQRNNSILKYTIYIIEIRIKNIRQKVFIRYSELLELQDFIKDKYQINIKNNLLKTTWLMNHKPKKIEQRKMCIQRFLKEVLSKQQIIEDGADVLIRLALPSQFYDLPKRYKQAQDLLRKSTFSQRSTSSQEQVNINKMKQSVCKSKRSSIFHTISQLKSQEQSFYQQKKLRNKSKRISIQDILQANQINLGHYTRYTQIVSPNMNEEQLDIDVLIPWIQNQRGFVKEKVVMRMNQRVLCLIEQLSQQIELKYFKDFRLYLEREYAGRLLDDDEYLPKVVEEMRCGKYHLIFKKMIFVTPEIQERQIRNDRVRLKIIASQVIYQCKKDKYLLNYHSILKLSILIGITQLFKDMDLDQISQQIDPAMLKNKKLATKTRQMITNTYTSFYDGKNTWQNDYLATFQKIYNKLKMIGRQNSQIFRISGIKNVQKQYNTTNVSQLAAISIIMEIKNNVFYGSVSFIVQISQQFRSILHCINDQEEDSIDNRNCWLVVKYNQVYLYSISLTNRIFSFNTQDIFKIQPYPASIILHFRGKQVDFIKLKTTNSFSIRQLLLYYKNYNQMIYKMEQDQRFEESIIQLVKQQNRQSCLHRRNTLNQ